MSQLQIILLREPILTLTSDENSFQNNLFPKILSLKYHGYSKRHTGNILPLDTTDFIGTHLIVCEKENNDYFPLMAYKSTTIEMCDKYGINFPFLNLLENSGNKICYDETIRIIKKLKEESSSLSYDTSWTMSPRLEGQKEKREYLKEILQMLLVNYHQDYNIPNWVTFGICKVKTDLLFKSMGGVEISSSPIVEHPGLGGQRSVAILLPSNLYLFHALRMGQKHKKLWENRMVISIEEANKLKIAV